MTRVEMLSATKNLDGLRDLKVLFKRDRNFLLDREINSSLLKSGSLFAQSNTNLEQNILEMFDRQIDLDDIRHAYVVLRKKLNSSRSRSVLSYLAKNSKNVLVWKFLTSVLEWNLGTYSLRFIIKDQNKFFIEKDHWKYIFHRTNELFVCEDDMINFTNEAASQN